MLRKANEECWAVKADMWLLYCACVPITPHSKCSYVSTAIVSDSSLCCVLSVCLFTSVLACCILFALCVSAYPHVLFVSPCLPDRPVLVCRVRVCLVCSVKGAWSCWSSWSQCTVPCGGGHYQRTRTCTSPAPAHGGDICIGLHTEEALCNTHTCQGKPTIRTSNKTKLTHCLKW